MIIVKKKRFKKKIPRSLEETALKRQSVDGAGRAASAMLVRSLPIRVEKRWLVTSLQWGAADAETKVPSDENTELKGSPFQAWSRSVYCHACCAYCQGFLPR